MIETAESKPWLHQYFRSHFASQRWASNSRAASAARRSYRVDGFTALFDFVFPRQLIKRRLVATSAVTIFRYVDLLMFIVVFDPNTMLSAPAVAFSVNPTCLHMRSI
jgi:hypothetical protein